MKAVAPGDLLEVHATDPDAPKDFQAFCETTGHELLESRSDAGTFVIRIRKAA